MNLDNHPTRRMKIGNVVYGIRSCIFYLGK
jgi:hypothetical protein